MKSFKDFFNEGTGAGTNWVDGDVEITLQDILELSSEPEQVDPSIFEPLLINVSRDPERVDNADLSFPIVVSTRGGKPKKILDGQHRIVKAIKNKQPIQVRYLDLDTAPEHFQQMFSEGGKDRCYRIGRRKYKVFPSAYASGAIERCRQGKIWKDIKSEETVQKEENLRDWFKRQGGSGKSKGWVDCNTCRKDKKTGRKKCKSCGRQKGEKRSKYPACRPTPSQCTRKGMKAKKSSKRVSWKKK